jgi:hypothetical protein
MPFQIVEIAFDDADSSTRRVVPYPFNQREEAVATIQSIISKYENHGYEPEHDYWWAKAANGDGIRFIIEAV